MDPATFAVILLVVGAIIFLVVQDWFNPYIVSANPIGARTPPTPAT